MRAYLSPDLSWSASVAATFQPLADDGAPLVTPCIHNERGRDVARVALQLPSASAPGRSVVVILTADDIRAALAAIVIAEGGIEAGRALVRRGAEERAAAEAGGK